MPNANIHYFQSFNDFHKMAKGAVRTIHDDVQVFDLHEVGKDAVQQTPLFKTNFYQIGLFSEVNFEVGYFGKTQKVKQKNVVVLFKPGQTASFTRADENSKGFIIMFKEHFPDFRLSNANTLKDFSVLNPELNSVLFVDDEPFNDLMDIAQKMYKEYGQIILLKTETVLKLFCQILVEKINRLNSELVAPILNSLHYKTTQDFKTLVFQNIHKTKSVTDYAAMLCITEKTLINHVKQITSSTPKDFINQVVAEESKAMLRNNTAVDKVSDHFNFTDQAHFSNFFKKMTGQSPREFKKEI